MKAKKVLVVGYYGDGNTGDEAILTSILRDFRTLRDSLEFTVPSYGPGAAGLEKRHGVRSFHFQDMTRMLDAVESADLVLVGGGGLLHDLWPPEPERMLTSEHWGLNYYCGIPWLAAGLGKRVMIYAAGVGPLLYPEGRDLVRDLARVSRAITLRDGASAEILAGLSPEMPRPEVTADPVWRLDPIEGAARAEFLKRAGVPSGPWLGVAVRNWNVGVDQEDWERELVAGVREFVSPRGLGVLFLPFQQAETPLQDDVGLARRIAARMPEWKTHVLADPCTPEELGGAIGACDLLLGMRLHSVVFACMTGTPAVALDYDPKVDLHTGLLDPPLPSVKLAGLTSAQLVGALETAWNARAEMPARQRALARELRERAARNAEAALELLDRPAPAERPEVRETFRAVRRIEELKAGGVAVAARPEGWRDGSGKRRGERTVRIITSTFFDTAGNDMAFGGAERYLIELARVVRGLGYEVEVFQRAAGQGWVRYYRDLRVTGVVPKDGFFRLDSAIAEISPAEPALTIYFAFYLGQDAPPDAVGISHCLYWDDPYYQSDPALLEEHVERALASVERLGTLVSVDTNTINWVRATRGALAAKCVYLPNFADTEIFRPRPRRDRDRIAVLFPCRLQPPKGFWLVAEILPELLERHPQLDFHFVGKAGVREEEAVRALVQSHRGRVSWESLPPERMHEAYDAADIVVLPTIAAEGTSLSCLEAQASGKAVIATHVGGLADLVLNEHNGLVIEPSAAALSSAIERLLLDGDLRERLGRNASVTAFDFRIERWRARWETILRERLPQLPPAALARAARDPITALFPRQTAAGLLRKAAEELARLGVDTYWIGTGRGRPLPRLHELSESDDLYLLRPLVFVSRPEDLEGLPEESELVLVATDPVVPQWWAGVSDRPGRRVVSRIVLAGGEDASGLSLASVASVREALRRSLASRRAEGRPLAAQRPAAAPGAASPAGAETPASKEARLFAMARELESAIAAMRRESLLDRAGWRQAAAESEQRAGALRAELSAAQAFVQLIQSEREATVAGLNARLDSLEKERAALSRDRDAAVAAWDAAERDRAALSQERDTAVAMTRETVDARDRAEEVLSRQLREKEAALSAAQGRLASRDKEVAALEEERNRKSAALAAARRQLDAVRKDLQKSVEESLDRHRHLGFAMQEIDRLRNTPWARIERGLRKVAAPFRHPRQTLFRLSAPGTPLYEFGLRITPGPIARWMRRAFAPHPPPEIADASLAPKPEPSQEAGDMPLARGGYDVLVFSIIDWDFRFQRPQQLAAQFGRNGHRVFFLSTTKFLVGPDRQDWKLFPRVEGVGEVHIGSRRYLDVYGGQLESEDLDTLERSFESLAERFGIGDAVCLVEIPFWWPMAKRLRQRFGWRVVYDCMDEWTNFPGFGKRVLTLEEELVREGDVTVASADRLLEKWNGSARRLVLARNGVDLRHYRAHYGENTLLGDVRRPVIGYYGALASWVDVPLIAKVARRYPQATIVLAGGRFDLDLSPVEALPNVRLLGQRPYEEMPGLLWNFDVCMIPFVVNDITEATNPVKFYEYLYGGKPVVAPELQELKPFAAVSYLADGHDEFLSQLDRALAEATDDPRRAQRRQIAEANDWSMRYRAIDEAVREAYPLVSVVVVTYGALDLTRACLDSLLGEETWPRFEVVVVDNGSTDGTPEYLQSVAARDSRVRCVLNEENLGFAAANNRGIVETSGEIVVLLNNDTVVPPGLFGRLVSHLERDRSIGLLCPTTNFCGNEAKIEPGYTDIAGLPGFAARRARDFEGQVFDIAVAAMYCVAARAEVLRAVGPLDEAFGVGLFEDDDFAIRMRQAGYRVACAQDAYVHHVGQGSFSKLSPGEYAAIWTRNQAYFEAKWGRSWEAHRTRTGVAAPVSRVPPARPGQD